MKVLFFQNKTRRVNHAVIFISNVSKKAIEFLDFTHICDNCLMPGGNNRPYALNKPGTFAYGLLTYLQVFIYDIVVPPGKKGLNVI